MIGGRLRSFLKSVNRKHDLLPPQSQSHKYPDTEKNPHVLVWGSNSQPSSSIVMHARRRCARLASSRLPFPACPGPASPWTFALGHQYLSLGPRRRSPGNNGGGVASASVQALPRAALGARLHRFPLWEEPGAGRTRLSQPGPQRPRPEPPAPGASQ